MTERNRDYIRCNACAESIACILCVGGWVHPAHFGCAGAPSNGTAVRSNRLANDRFCNQFFGKRLNRSIFCHFSKCIATCVGFENL